MGRFISNFATTAEFAAFSATTDFGRPHVSLTKDSAVVHYFTQLPAQYQWVDDGYTCVEFDKYTKKKQQVSYDGGTTWTDTGAISAVTLVEHNSEDCGYVPPETRVVATFNVTGTSNPTRIGYYSYISGFSAIEIDGVELPSVVSAYTFSTTGEHTVKYTLTDPTSIGDSAFRECYGITNIIIPDNVTTIGGNAFLSCDSIASVDIPDSVTTIGDNAFAVCTSLTTCTIGSGVTSIGSYAFSNCHSLTSIEIPDSVTTIGDSAFYNCDSLTSIDIPDSVISIGSSAFEYCSGLTSIEIPNSVTTIGQFAFQECRGLTSCTIGSGVTSIGTYTFCGCPITSMTCNAIVPPDTDGGLGLPTCPTEQEASGSGSGGEPPMIYVPAGSVATYKAATGWSDYECNINAI